MGRIVENVYLGTQDGAMLGSNTSLLGVRFPLEKEIMLGPYKISLSQSRWGSKNHLKSSPRAAPLS